MPKMFALAVKAIRQVKLGLLECLDLKEIMRVWVPGASIWLSPEDLTSVPLTTESRNEQCVSCFSYKL